MEPRHFETSEQMRAWLEKNHDQEKELWVGFYKKGVDEANVSYDDAVEVALCFGWIDGIVRRVDDRRYMHRLSPRTARSPWSKLNVERANRLIAEGKMHPAGKAALDRREDARTGIYGYEIRPRELDPASRKLLEADPAAWKFFQAQAPWYRRTVAHWILSAKRPETRARRVDVVLRASQSGRRIDLLSPPSGKRPRRTQG